MKEVIIVGGNHHNGLGLARIFGLNNVRVHSIVVDNGIESFLSKSKYVSTCVVFKTENEAYSYVKNAFAQAKEKMVLIPYSDGAAYELDNRLDEFSEHFHIPSINGEQGKIASLMDKQQQYEFAKNTGIKIAYTITIDFKLDIREQIKEMPFPCIIKPVISAEGNKKDIAICTTPKELFAQIDQYKSRGYWRALVQEYLEIDYEIDVFGCTLQQKPYICEIPTRTIRSWPAQRGTNSFSRIIIDDVVAKECKCIISKLRSNGFYGLYDIELFVVKGEIFLNEINWRNSGDVYMGIEQGYYYPYAWYLDCLGEQVEIEERPREDTYAMTECADLRNVLRHNIGIVEWIKAFKKSKDCALKFHSDMKPAYNRYVYYVKQFLRKKNY